MSNLYGVLPSQTVDGKTFNAIKVSIPNPHKIAYLRLPTAQEMLDHFNKPAKVKKDQTPEELSLQLFTVLRVDEGGTEFDEYEASSVVDALTRSRGLSFDRVGSTYEISVETPFNTTTHTLNVPTQKQLTIFRRAAVKNYTNAVTTLYADLYVKCEGYIETMTKEEVPPHHKLDVVNQIFLALDNLDPILDPNA